jgi:hypothetical protein
MILAEPITLPGGAGGFDKSRLLTNDIIIKIMLAGVTNIEVLDPVAKPSASEMPTPHSSTNTSTTGSPAMTPPHVRVIIDETAMSARIELSPAGPESEELSPESLHKTLEDNGVVFGVNESKLLEITLRWSGNKETCSFEDVAMGSPPTIGKEGPCHFIVPHLTTVHELDIVRKAKYWWEAAKFIPDLHRVSKGAVVAEKKFEINPQQGMTVKGDPVTVDGPPEETVMLGPGVSRSDDGKSFVAKTDGVLYFVNNAIGIHDLDFNGSFDLVTDAMSARLVIHPPGEGGAMPPETELRDLLSNKQVVFGINDEVIRELMAKFAEGEIPSEEAVVAEGLAPEHGQNGKVEFLFNTKTSLAPKVNPDGSVDYKNVDIILAVPGGKELARLAPPVPGKPGTTIFGDEIPCREGSPAALPIGPNTESRGDALLASIDGIVRYTGAYVEVCEGYVINGDVDFSTGNIHYDKSVIINGDVKSGFSIDCGGDLQVSGLIEDCTINVGGNILCKHGFIGQGKGIIDAKGDVNIGFILNQTVKSRKSVNIAREAINCTIYSRQSITIHGNPLSIAGGTLVARENITVHTVGNHSGVRTNLEVGLDFALLEELKKNEELMVDISQKRFKLTDSIKKYQRMRKLGKQLAPQEEILYNKLNIAISKIDEQMNLLEKRKTMIEQKVHELENAHIKIEHTGMPGTCFKIGDLRHFCKDEVVGPKTVRLVKGEISIT